MQLNTYSWQHDIIINLPLLGSKLYGKPPIWAGGGLPKGSPYNNGESGDPVERTWKIKGKIYRKKPFMVKIFDLFAFEWQILRIT